MAFGFADFGEFIIRPFTNPMGWIMLLGAGVYIWARVTGRIGSPVKGKKGKGGGSRQADYTIK